MAEMNPEINKTIQKAINKKIWTLWLTIALQSVSLIFYVIVLVVFLMAVWHGGVILVGESPKDCFIFGKIHGLKTLFN